MRELDKIVFANFCDKVFEYTKMDDIFVEVDEHVHAHDWDGNEWQNEHELMQFIVEDCLSWTPDGHIEKGYGKVHRIESGIKNWAKVFGVAIPGAAE